MVASAPPGRPPAQATPDRVGASTLCLAAAWNVAVAACGGLVGFWMLDQFGVVGAIGFWPLGVVAGIVSRKITQKPSRPAGALVVGACILAYLVADVCYIHWRIDQGAEGWWKSCTLLPTYFKEFRTDVLVEAIMTGCGAYNGWWYATRPLWRPRQDFTQPTNPS